MPRPANRARERERNDLQLFELKEQLRRALLGVPLPSGPPDYAAALQRAVQVGHASEIGERLRGLFEHIERNYET